MLKLNLLTCYVCEHEFESTNLNVIFFKKAIKIQRLTTDQSKKSPFNYDLGHVLISTNISFHKLQNATFKSFLETYTNTIIPEESTLRKILRNN